MPALTFAFHTSSEQPHRIPSVDSALGGTTETAVTTRGLYRILDHRPIVVIARNNPLKNQPINSPRAYSSPWARLSHFEPGDLNDPPTAPYVIAARHRRPI